MQSQILTEANGASLLKRYTQSQLARLYNCTPQTLRNWLKPFKEKIGKRIGHTYSVEQVSAIFQVLGLPI